MLRLLTLLACLIGSVGFAQDMEPEPHDPEYDAIEAHWLATAHDTSQPIPLHTGQRILLQSNRDLPVISNEVCFKGTCTITAIHTYFPNQEVAEYNHATIITTAPRYDYEGMKALTKEYFGWDKPSQGVSIRRVTQAQYDNYKAEYSTVKTDLDYEIEDLQIELENLDVDYRNAVIECVVWSAGCAVNLIASFYKNPWAVAGATASCSAATWTCTAGLDSVNRQIKLKARQLKRAFLKKQEEMQKEQDSQTPGNGSGNGGGQGEAPPSPNPGVSAPAPKPPKKPVIKICQKHPCPDEA